MLDALVATVLLATRTLEASYHKNAAPMLIRFWIKYQISHSRNKILLRWNCWAVVGRPKPAGFVPLLQLVGGQETSTLSKCVPRRMEPGSVEEPVRNPFGLQINRSCPKS